MAVVRVSEHLICYSVLLAMARSSEDNTPPYTNSMRLPIGIPYGYSLLFA